MAYYKRPYSQHFARPSQHFARPDFARPEFDANICPKGLTCREACKLVHPGRRESPCRNGSECTRQDCWFTHPAILEADICPKALSCRGECKLVHIGRRKGSCRSGEFCEKIGTCPFSHPLPSPCYRGFECSDKKKCDRKHETKEEYYLRLEAERPVVPLTAIFTSDSVDHTIDSEHNMVRHMCYCPRCPQIMIGSNLWCSDQCGDFTPESPQEEGMYNGTHGSRGPNGCYHEHSRCNIPNCERQCATDGDAYRLRAYPFCKFHAPKCACGLPTFTLKNWRRNPSASEGELAAMTAAYNSKCLRCYTYEQTRCNMPGCESVRISRDNMRKDHAFCKLHAPKCVCGDPTHTNTDWKSIATPTEDQLIEMKASYFRKCNNCCSVPECIKRRDFYQWPFCKEHAPKCLCGAVTHIVNGYKNGNDNYAYPANTREELDALERLYDVKCRQCYNEHMKTAVFGATRPSRKKCKTVDCPHTVQTIYRRYGITVHDREKKRDVVIAQEDWCPQIKCDTCSPKCSCGQSCLSHLDSSKGYYTECFACKDKKKKSVSLAGPAAPTPTPTPPSPSPTILATPEPTPRALPALAGPDAPSTYSPVE